MKSYDHNLLDKSANQIVKTVENTGAIVRGPIPLPTHKRIITVNRSTFVNKRSRVQFMVATHKRIIDVYNAKPSTIEALGRLEIPGGVDVEIKL